MTRPSWDSYFIQFAYLAASRSTCIRRKVGAVLVRDRQILATGYNGAPRSTQHCFDVGCYRQQHQIPSGQQEERCRGVHAEQNAVAQAAKHGVAVNGATLYCTNAPCVTCTKLLINVGIVRIVYSEPYENEMCDDMLKLANIQINKHTN
jgi:dCMP deaminase